MGTSTLGLTEVTFVLSFWGKLFFTEGFCLPAAGVTSFVEKRAALATQKCCCVTVAEVPPCVLVSRSDASAHPCSHPLPQFYSGISMCKYLLIPPPSLSFSLPSPLSALSLFINGPHSLPLTLCMPVCPSPPALPLYSLLWFSSLPVPFHGPNVPSQALVSSAFMWVLSLTTISGSVSFQGFWYLDANLDVVIWGLDNIHWHLWEKKWIAATNVHVFLCHFSVG